MKPIVNSKRICCCFRRKFEVKGYVNKAGVLANEFEDNSQIHSVDISNEEIEFSRNTKSKKGKRENQVSSEPGLYTLTGENEDLPFPKFTSQGSVLKVPSIGSKRSKASNVSGLKKKDGTKGAPFA